MPVGYTNANVPQLITTTDLDSIYTADCNGTWTSDNDWYVSLGTGMTVGNGAGNIVNMEYYSVTSGTTASSESIFLLKKAFRPGASIDFGFDRSTTSGTTNQNFYIEIVEVDPALLISSPSTAVVTIGTSTQVKDARNCFQIALPPSTTTIQYYVRSKGNTVAQMSASMFPQNATIQARAGTTPNFIAGNMYQLSFRTDGITLNSSVAGTSVNAGLAYSNHPQPSSTGSGNANGQAAFVDPNKWYALRIRLVHGSSAPAASITYNFYRPRIMQVSPAMVDNTRSPEKTNPFAADPGAVNNNAIIVRPVNTQTQVLYVNVTNAALNISGASSLNSTATSSTALGSAAVYTSSTMFPINQLQSINVTCYSDVASGTNGLEIQCSSDTTTWRTVASATAAAGTFTTLKQNFYCNASGLFSYFRVRYTNGGTAQTVFTISSSLCYSFATM